MLSAHSQDLRFKDLWFRVLGSRVRGLGLT